MLLYPAEFLWASLSHKTVITKAQSAEFVLLYTQTLLWLMIENPGSYTEGCGRQWERQTVSESVILIHDQTCKAFKILWLCPPVGHCATLGLPWFWTQTCALCTPHTVPLHTVTPHMVTPHMVPPHTVTPHTTVPPHSAWFQAIPC